VWRSARAAAVCWLQCWARCVLVRLGGCYVFHERCLHQLSLGVLSVQPQPMWPCVSRLLWFPFPAYPVPQVSPSGPLVDAVLRLVRANLRRLVVSNVQPVSVRCPPATGPIMSHSVVVSLVSAGSVPCFSPTPPPSLSLSPPPPYQSPKDAP
jgi:hypothetical protein